MPTISDKDVLSRFEYGKDIDSQEELDVLNRYFNTGMVHFWFNYITKKGTAGLTIQGKWFLEQM